MKNADVFKHATTFKINYRNRCNGLTLLAQMKDNSVKAVFFDPQYRGILDKLNYGNEGVRRGQARSTLQQMDEKTITNFLSEIARILAPAGYLFLWVDKFHLVEGIQNWLQSTLSLSSVDMITWNKLKMGMGYRSRRMGEYCIIIQKHPQLAKETWKSHNIPDIWNEKIIKNHPHSKPVELQKALIVSVTEKEDLIVDPAAGGYSVLTACQLCNRNFLGGDIEFGENE